MFERVFGHQRILEMLGRMIERDALHHGLCFHGPNGIGKRLTAQEVARAMVCENRTGCGSCRHCTKFDHGNHPDYREIAPQGNDIKVDQVRDIAENLHYRPFEASARIVVIDQAERMREEAANAFLKSLEEPPDYVYFILVCADLKALLPTILSRCQKVAFQSLTAVDKANILTHRFQLPADTAARLASISYRQLETDEAAWNVFDGDVRHILEGLAIMLREGHAIDHFSEAVGDKQNLPRFMDHLVACIRALTLMSAGVKAPSPFEHYSETMQPLAENLPSKAWRSLWDELTRLWGQRRRNLNQRLWFNAMTVNSLGLVEASAARLDARLAQHR